ncbi:MAG: type II toxin-antitoxin system PemK/MazF family toxin [Thermoanaerobaculia bacterium]|nr:type II toxin-antitoxin system PemK/MazF family toxin [Thermoanaerobaculia bacterium]
MKLERGSVVLVALDPTLGHEQRGTRPAVLVSDLAVIADQRFPLVGILPVTSTPGSGALYPRLSPGESGLRKESWAMVDQLRSVDKRRILQVFGRIRRSELAAIDDGLRLYLGLRS